MHLTSSLHQLTIKEFVSLLLGSLTMIWLSCLPQSLLAQSPENGQTSYQQKCAACHTIGGGRLVGPDLKGVHTKRDPSWLVRWIQEPDKMLAEGDSIATQQLKEYNNILMPNLGVSNTEAKDIIAYIAAESSGGQSAAAPTVKPVKPVVASSSQVGNVANGKQVYQKCTVCHTIGGGRMIGSEPGHVGPDLKGVTSRRELSWLVRWIQEPDKMLDEGDPIATQLLQEYNNVRMPNWSISETDARDILAYIAAESGGELSSSPEPTSQPSDVASTTATEVAAPAGDADTGQALFVGQESFANGAPACISCHTTSDVSGLGGGTLGPDLTKVHSRFGGDVGLKSVLGSLPFPTMQAVYSKKPLVTEETVHLTAYFAQSNSMAEKPSMDFTISMISIGGFIILYILTHLIWRKRLTGVRIPLVGR